MKLKILKNNSLSALQQQKEKSVNYFVQKAENNKLLTFVSDWFNFMPVVQIATIKKVTSILQLQNSKNLSELNTTTITNLNELFFSVVKTNGLYQLQTADRFLPTVLENGFYFFEVNIGNNTILISELFEVCYVAETNEPYIICSNPRMLVEHIDYAQQLATRPTFKINFSEMNGFGGTVFIEIRWSFLPVQNFDDYIFNFIMFGDSALSSYIDHNFTVTGDGTRIISGDEFTVDGSGNVEITSVLPSALILQKGSYYVEYTTNTGCTGQTLFFIDKSCFDCADGSLVLSKPQEDSGSVTVRATYSIAYTCSETMPVLSFTFTDSNGFNFGTFPITPTVVGFEYQYIRDLLVIKNDINSIRKIFCEVSGDCGASAEITIQEPSSEIQGITIAYNLVHIYGNCNNLETFEVKFNLNITNNTNADKIIKMEISDIFFAPLTRTATALATTVFGQTIQQGSILNTCIPNLQIKLTEITTGLITNIVIPL